MRSTDRTAADPTNTRRFCWRVKRRRVRTMEAHRMSGRSRCRFTQLCSRPDHPPSPSCEHRCV